MWGFGMSWTHQIKIKIYLTNDGIYLEMNIFRFLALDWLEKLEKFKATKALAFLCFNAKGFPLSQPIQTQKVEIVYFQPNTIISAASRQYFAEC